MLKFLFIFIPVWLFAQTNLPSLSKLPDLPALPALTGHRRIMDIRPKATAEIDITPYLAPNDTYGEINFDLFKNSPNKSDTLNLNQFLWLFLEGIAQGVETSGHANPYYAVNKYSSARGRWQMTNAFWQHYSYLACDSLGLPRHVLTRTPRHQRLVAYWAARDMFWRHYRPWRSPLQIISLMAKEWYGGKKAINTGWNIAPSPWQNKLTFRQYTRRVIKKIFKLNHGQKIILSIKKHRGTKS